MIRQGGTKTEYDTVYVCSNSLASPSPVADRPNFHSSFPTTTTTTILSRSSKYLPVLIDVVTPRIGAKPSDGPFCFVDLEFLGPSPLEAGGMTPWQSELKQLTGLLRKSSSKAAKDACHLLESRYFEERSRQAVYSHSRDR